MATRPVRACSSCRPCGGDSTTRRWLGSIAADRPGFSVLVCDHELPEGDRTPQKPCRLRTAPSREGGGCAGALGLLHLGDDGGPEGGAAHRLSVLVSALAMSECLDVTPEDVSGLVFPFTHIGGIGWLMAALVAGCRVVITEGFDADGDPGASRQERRDTCRVGDAVPHGLLRRAAPQTPEAYLFPDVRAFPGGGAPKPPQLHRDLKARDRRRRDRVGLRADRGADRLHGDVQRSRRQARRHRGPGDTGSHLQGGGYSTAASHVRGPKES